jgi:hypothetical protein
MINLEDYKDLIDKIRKLDDEVPISGSTEGDVCGHGNSYASNCSDCDEEVIEDTEYLDWYEKWKKENFKNHNIDKG